MKRILLFLATNLAVLLVVSVVLQLAYAFFGVNPGGMTASLIFAGVIGFGGSLISLAISKWMAIRLTGATVITKAKTKTESWLLTTVSNQAAMAGIAKPEVAIYPAQDINAFATGASKRNALVAVSAGMLKKMTHDEIEAVLAHEISHIANGDMITLALIQGVVNTFVIFFARVVASAITRSSNKSNGGFAYYGIVLILEMVFGVLASVIVMAFSRYREYRADAGGASLSSKAKMIAALQRLKSNKEPEVDNALTAFAISGKSGLATLFMSHPPLEKRIEALKQIHVNERNP